MNFQPQAYRINDFVNWQASKELILSPKFQRRKVWTTRGKSYLIDSILRGMPVPQFFIREKIDPELRRTIREVVDGQQRLTAILQFIEGAIYVMKSHSLSRRQIYWAGLTSEQQTAFLSYSLSVNVLGGATDADVLAVFSRINAYSLPLNTQEKLNAEYVGEFRQFVDQLASEHLAFWTRNDILTEQRIARMGDSELIAELLGVMLRGLQNQKKIVGQLYHEFDEVFEPGLYLHERFADILQLGDLLCGEKLKDTIFRRSTLFYSLFAAAYDLQYGFGAGADTVARKIDRTTLPKVTQDLMDLSAAVDQANLTSANEKRFYDAARSSTDKLPERTVRHEILTELIKLAFKRR